MPQTRTRSGPWIHTKVCPSCGYRGAEVQAIEESRTFECPNCLADLYARPPKSYAEMEGIGHDGCSVRTRLPVAADADLVPERKRRFKWLRGLLARFARLTFRRGLASAKH